MSTMKLSSPQTPVQTNKPASEEPHQTSASLGQSRRRLTCTCAYLTKKPKAINNPADNDCASECPDKYAKALVAEYDATNAAEHSTNYSHEY